MTDDEQWEKERRDMVQTLRHYEIRDERLLSVMGRIPRHLFIPDLYRVHGLAYGDHPCQIGERQTISQPYIVAYMTEKLGITPGDKVLEIGTGSGYQSAVLAGMGARVFTVEIIPSLAQHSLAILGGPEYAGLVHCRQSNGYAGWPEEAPFDAIIVTCGPEKVPSVLIDQLREEGRMIVPAGPSSCQRLVMVRKTNGVIQKTNDLPVMFVPMVTECSRNGNTQTNA